MAPRLNAAGRMGSADAALELLLMRGKDDATRAGAQSLARQLSEENGRRQAEEAAIVTEAKRVVDGDPDIGGHQPARGGRRRLASRCHRHCRVQADGGL
jgi:single-stranded DNA-specific DHH superfamily exonuclease